MSKKKFRIFSSAKYYFSAFISWWIYVHFMYIKWNIYIYIHTLQVYLNAHDCLQSNIICESLSMPKTKRKSGRKCTWRKRKQLNRKNTNVKSKAKETAKENGMMEKSFCSLCEYLLCDFVVVVLQYRKNTFM